MLIERNCGDEYRDFIISLDDYSHATFLLPSCPQLSILKPHVDPLFSLLVHRNLVTLKSTAVRVAHEFYNIEYLLVL